MLLGEVMLLFALAVPQSHSLNDSSLLKDSVEGQNSGQVGEINFEAPSMAPDMVTFNDDAPFEQEAITLPEMPVMALSGDQIETMNTDESTWTATTYNEFEGKDVRRKCGAILVPAQMRQLSKAVHSDIAVQATNLPDSFDARIKWPECRTINHIRDQGDCQSCWAVAAASVMSDRYCIHLNIKTLRIASTDLVNCCGVTCAPNKGDGCEGGYPNKAFEYWINNSLPTEQCNAYIPKMQTCNKACDNPAFAWADDQHQGTSSYRVGPDASQIQTEIMKFGPVTAGFTVHQDFINYQSGVYQHKTGDVVGAHAVRIIGWGVEKDTPYWLIANTWTTMWGEDGFFKFFRGSNHLGIEGWVHTGVPSNFLSHDS